MRNFLRRFVKFAVVPLILLLVPLYIILISKEILSLDEMIRKQEQDSSVLIGCSLTYIDPYLKAEKSRILQPDILVLGTSRTMQFRRSFFNPAFSFYNAGGGVAHIHEFQIFLEQTQVKPVLLIIGLDQYFFNPSWEKEKPAVFNYKYTRSVTTMLLSNMCSIYDKLLSSKVRLTQLYKNSNIGLLAKCDGDGFRCDGSYFYNRIISEPSLSLDFQFRDTWQRIEEGSRRFEYNDSVCLNSIRILDRFLAYCYENSIEVIAYLPPYAPTVWDKLISVGKYAYMTKIDAAIRPLFEKYQFTLYDFSDGEKLGCENVEFIDGFHGSDKTYLRMMLEMSKSDNSLKTFFKTEPVLVRYIHDAPDIYVAE